jgi:hypothetical protein
MNAAPPMASEHRKCLLQNSPQFGKPAAIAPESIQSEFGNECDRNSVWDIELRIQLEAILPVFILPTGRQSFRDDATL